MLGFAVAAAVALGGWPRLAAAQADAATQIAQLAAKTSLDGEGMAPWHLKVSFLTMDTGSTPSGEGSVEEWWAAPDRWRQEMTADGKTSVSVRTPEGLFRSPSFTPPAWPVALLLQQILHPIDQSDIQEARPETRQQQFGKVSLQCTMLAQPIKGVSTIPLGLYPTYCAEGDKLRVTWLSTNINVVTQQMGAFQGHNAATKVQVSLRGKMLLEGSVEQLATFKPEDGQFSTENLTERPVSDTLVSSGVMAGRKIGGPAPMYPASARQNRVSGSVVMKARIGTDDRVHNLQVMSSPDADLSLAAVIAVQQWEYTPYLLNGEPTAVSTTITVNFNLGPR